MRLIVTAILAFVFAALHPALPHADEAQLRGIIAGFPAARNYDARGELIGELAATGDAAVVPFLEQLSEGNVQFRKSDREVFIVSETGGKVLLLDPLSGEQVGEAQSTRELDKVKVNNRLRRQIRDAIGALTLGSQDPALRAHAAQLLVENPNPDALEAIETALASETDETVKSILEQARAAAILLSDRPDEDKATALDRIADLGSRDALSLLLRFQQEAEGDLRTAVDKAIARVEQRLAVWDMGQNLWYGLSLGSVLLLAAIGLAITFGVMGVINMAHGEMVMLGAYTTFVVQEVMRTSAPGLLDWSLTIALPLAFLVAGSVGFALERGVIRFLYGRPLETLLATWGVSLVLQQSVRSIFGPTNREVSNPSWMSGSFDLGELTLTWNRLYIVIFALVVFAVLLWAFNHTSFGLRMRAVTQNRRMAASMGIRTPWVDALTFALGSGIAGIAGVALSQIDNVSPNLGQSYIIDSFMVVVFGGVGNLWGTLVGAMSLGIVNKFLEPYAGAVLGKILVLVFIILFIQKRPRGLFALKGRAIDA